MEPIRILLLLAFCAGMAQAAPARGAYPHVELSFDLPGIKGNPFDFDENDVMVAIARTGSLPVKVPAFFDGGSTWRVRFTPDQPGMYSVRAVTRNGVAIQPAALDRREFIVPDQAGPGFVRVDRDDRSRLAFDDGTPYYPLGHNLGWRGRGMALTEYLAEMGAAGVNWTRIWMCHWGGMNLDWVQGQKLPAGELSLDVARRWDEVVQAAEKQGVYLQMVLQHHGQYSTAVNPNWNENPWNAANGGWLASPEEFFTDERAMALTRAKYRYIIARWGYSPAVLAWELFNEVEWTDAMRKKQADRVAAWHSAMASFIRKQDPYRHLVTTSSTMEPAALWAEMDFYQPHAYPPDAASAIRRVDDMGLRRPYFIGEIGPSEGLMEDDGRFLHRALWAGLMSPAAGAAQYWTWEVVSGKRLYGHFRAASLFLQQSKMATRAACRRLAVGVSAPASGPLTLAPGAGWASAKRTEFPVLASGEVPGMGEMPSFLQGNAHREMFPSATFRADYPYVGRFVVSIGQAAKAGARVVLSVDGKPAAEREFPAAEADTRVNVTLEAEVPPGAHAIKLENTGADWVTINAVTLDPYVPVLAALGKGNRDFAAVWVTHRAGADAPAQGIRGTLEVPGLDAGPFQATWWDTYTGKPLGTERVIAGWGRPVRLATPAVSSDVALWLERAR